MNMEGESRKRKMEEEDEEEKMEEFFALIRSTREARGRMMRGLPEEEKKKGEDEKAVEGWNPAFRPEDFTGDGGGGSGDQSKVHQASLAVAGPSGRENESKEEDKETRDGDKGGGADGLDLKLSL